MKQKDSILEDFQAFVKDLFLYKPFKVSATLILMILVGITNGLSIAILIPLLQVIGFGESTKSAGNLSEAIVGFFSFFSYTPTLSGVLIAFFFLVLIITFL